MSCRIPDLKILLPLSRLNFASIGGRGERVNYQAVRMNLKAEYLNAGDECDRHKWSLHGALQSVNNVKVNYPKRKNGIFCPCQKCKILYHRRKAHLVGYFHPTIRRNAIYDFQKRHPVYSQHRTHCPERSTLEQGSISHNDMFLFGFVNEKKRC